MIGISYAITVADEIPEFKNLIERLNYSVDQTLDEIVILSDISKQSRELFEYLETCKAKIFCAKFEGDFAKWKNKLNSYCSKDFIFQIDADELPSEELLRDIHTILSNTEAEIVAVPRQNRVAGITQKDIAQWHWVETDKGINWPDYQWRIYKNTPTISWKGKVHERPVGYEKYAVLPNNQTLYRLDHFKTIEKQRQQNSYYSTLLDEKRQ